MGLNTMIADRIALGHQAKLDIQISTSGPWLAFNIIEGNYSDMGQKSDVTDSEAPRQTSNAVGLETFTLSVTAQLDYNLDPWYYLTLNPGDLVAIRLHPWGRTRFIGQQANRNNHYNIPAFRVIGFDGSMVVQGSRPQTIRISGESNYDSVIGSFTRPGTSGGLVVLG